MMKEKVAKGTKRTGGTLVTEGVQVKKRARKTNAEVQADMENEGVAKGSESITDGKQAKMKARKTDGEVVTDEEPRRQGMNRCDEKKLAERDLKEKVNNAKKRKLSMLC